MASRLSRWAVVTVLAIVLTMVILLPPGVSPLASWYAYTPSEPTNSLDAAVAANRRALDGAQFALRNVALARGLHPYLTGSRSPIVVREIGDSVTVDTILTAVAESLWHTVTRHPAAPRTVLVIAGWNWGVLRITSLPGSCVGLLALPGRHDAPISSLRAGAGGCLLATEFGPAGRGLDAWLNVKQHFDLPGANPRGHVPIRELHPSLEQWVAGHGYDPTGVWWWSRPSLNACLGGREDFCQEAMGLAPDRSSLYRPWSLYFESWGLNAALPAALLDDLGPARFSILWHSDEPLPAAYAKLTGRPFDAWALDFAQHQVGRIVKENALTSGGWAGWVFWMALLFAWLAVRMREQPAQ